MLLILFICHQRSHTKKQFSEKFIVKLIRLNFHNHINSKFNTINKMSNQKRASKNKQKFVYYLNILFKTTHVY